MAKKKEVNLTKAIIIAAIILILFRFAPKPVSYGEAGRIARETLYNDPIIGNLKARILIDLLSISDEGNQWRVQAVIICQRNAAQLCEPSSLRERGLASTYTVFVDKFTGNAVIAYPYYST